MNVQCSEERLSSASRFDEWQLFARFRGRLAAMLDFRPTPSPTRPETPSGMTGAVEGVGQFAVARAGGEFEAITSHFVEIDENVGMGLINGPGPNGAVTAYGFDYLGPGESLL